MTTDQDLATLMLATMGRVVPMLLGNRRIKPTLVFGAGHGLDVTARVRLGLNAQDDDYDLVHVAPDAEGRLGRPDITLIAPRGRMVNLHTDCRLWLPPSGNRALIARPQGKPGYFRVLPREIVLVQRDLPGDREAGLARAEAVLECQLLSPGPVLTNGSVYGLAQAA